MRAAILAVLVGDGTLTGILTGEVHTAVEISRQETPSAFDANGEILPCALLKFSTQGEFGPFDDSSRLFFSVMFYERQGYVSIEAARARVYTLLHRQRVTLAVGGFWDMRQSDAVLDQVDETLKCSMALSRYDAKVNRV